MKIILSRDEERVVLESSTLDHTKGVSPSGTSYEFVGQEEPDYDFDQRPLWEDQSGNYWAEI